MDEFLVENARNREIPLVMACSPWLVKTVLEAKATARSQPNTAEAKGCVKRIKWSKARLTWQGADFAADAS